MAMIFPGMDPYLEDPAIWPGVHHAMVVYLADALQPGLGERYAAAIEERVYSEQPSSETLRAIVPDVSLRTGGGWESGGGAAVLEMDAPVVLDEEPVEVREPFIQLLDLHTGQKIVTVIELLSPANKRRGEGRNLYLRKQSEVRYSDAHLVEIDLLRDGEHTLAVSEAVARRRMRFDYAVCVHRAESLGRFEFYPCGLRHRLPRIRVPLAAGDADVPLDLQAVLEKTYTAGSYHLRLSYAAPPEPPLFPADEAWVRERIATVAK